jgi:hypothetical protein
MREFLHLLPTVNEKTLRDLYSQQSLLAKTKMTDIVARSAHAAPVDVYLRLLSSASEISVP